jgi:hypothetical protein
MAFQLIDMGKIALRDEQFDIRARLRNELNSFVEVPLYFIKLGSIYIYIYI